MARVDGAKERLQTAVSQLEELLTQLAARGPGEGGGGAADPRGEHGSRLEAELVASREENGALRQLTAEVSARLDAVIEELRTILDE